MFSFQSQAEIHYTDYGEDGWVIPMNANQAIDINGDEFADFYVNGYENELGVVPIPLIGCFTGASSYYNNLATRALQIHEKGDVISIDNNNMFDYVDDGRGTIMNPTIGFADGWTNMQEEYIGFAVFMPEDLSYVANGWMKVVVDAANLTLIIKEIAYEDNHLLGEGSIVVGETGQEVVSIDYIESLNDISIAPNPSNNQFQLSYDYIGSEELFISVQNSLGQEIHQVENPSSKSAKLNIVTSDWAQGIYFIRFETEKGIMSRKVLITR